MLCLQRIALVAAIYQLTPLLFSGDGSQPSPLVISQPISILSNCSYSYLPDTALDISTELRTSLSHFIAGPPVTVTNKSIELQLPESVLGLTPLKQQGTLRMFNAAFGTTGTRSLFQRDYRKYGSGCHWRDCKPKFSNRLEPHFMRLFSCIDGSVYGKKCSTTIWIKELRQLLIEYCSSGMRVFSDTPAAYLFSEFRNLAPNAVVQHSLRNPHVWVMKRASRHWRGDLICKRSLGISNAFHILQCINGSVQVQDNIETTMQYAKTNISLAQQYVATGMVPDEQNSLLLELAEHYAAFNTFVHLHTPPQLYQPECVWDAH